MSQHECVECGEELRMSIWANGDDLCDRCAKELFEQWRKETEHEPQDQNCDNADERA